MDDVVYVIYLSCIWYLVVVRKKKWSLNKVIKRWDDCYIEKDIWVKRVDTRKLEKKLKKNAVKNTAKILETKRILE